MASEPQLDPYAVSAIAADSPHESQHEITRRRYLSHEKSIRSIGTLYMVAATMLGLWTSYHVVATFVAFIEYGIGEQAFYFLGMSTFSALCALLIATTATGLWALKNWARIIAAVLSTFGLIVFPVGTVVSIYCLYLLLSAKGAYVFSHDYMMTIQLTPHIQQKHSPIVPLLLCTLFAILLFVWLITILA